MQRRNLLELPKLRALAGDGDEPALAAWCRFLSAETDDQLEALAMRYPILQEAKTALDELSADEEARFWALTRLLQLKFGDVPAAIQARVGAASQPELDAWLDAVLTADSVDAVFRDEALRE